MPAAPPSGRIGLSSIESPRGAEVALRYQAQLDVQAMRTSYVARDALRLAQARWWLQPALRPWRPPGPPSVADPQAVADALVAGMNFAWCGQSCGSCSRAFLHEAIHDRVIVSVLSRRGAVQVPPLLAERTKNASIPPSAWRRCWLPA